MNTAGLQADVDYTVILKNAIHNDFATQAEELALEDQDNQEVRQGDESKLSYEAMKEELVRMAEVLQQYPESLKPRVFEILLGKFLGELGDAPSPGGISGGSQPRIGAGDEVKTRKKTSAPESFKLLGDLNLIGGGDVLSFKTFCESKNLKSDQEFNSVAVYYLVRLAGIQDVTPDHVYTCYKDVSRKVPTSLKQTLRHTANRLGTIDVADMNRIKLTLKGENFIEHDLPARDSAKV